MDLNTLIIGLIISAIIFLPIAYIQLSQNRKKKLTHKVFMGEVLKRNFKISHIDFWGTYYAIAIDERQSKLIYSEKVDLVNQWIEIDLNTVIDCLIQKTDRRIKNKTSFKIETDRMELVIICKDLNYALEFYNVDINIQMTNEKELLEKWQALIKNNIKSFKKAA